MVTDFLASRPKKRLDRFITKLRLVSGRFNTRVLYFQVVVAMRDLFQVVFELKQKEIDDALKKMDKDKRVMPFFLNF